MSTATAQGAPPPPSAASRRWPTERVLFALAGTMTLLSALLAATVSPWFLLLAVFVAVNQWLFATVGTCGASIILGRTGFGRGCRW